MPNNVYTTTPLELIVGTFADSAQSISLSANSAGQANTISRGDHTHKFTAATGSTNGTIKLQGTDIAVCGLGSRAYDSTAYLPLTGGTVTGDITIKKSGIDLSQANNGSSSTVQENIWFSSNQGVDGVFQTNYLANGAVQVYMGCRNYGNGAWTGWKGITVQQAKDGTLTYTVSEAAAFRTAISCAAASHTHAYLSTSGGTISGNLTVTGYIYSSGSYVQAQTDLYFGSSGGSNVKTKYNSTWYDVIKNHNNGNISVNACGTGLYLGYSNCSAIYFYTGGAQRGSVNSSGINGALWNDFAEYRTSSCKEAGRVVIENGKGCLQLCQERLAPCAHIISDTYGISTGYSLTQDTPIGVGGRVLVYPFQNRENYKVGDAVCAAPNGTADIMTREEIINYPDRIIGIVSEIPDYDVWEQQASEDSEIVKVDVKNRIWIYVK